MVATNVITPRRREDFFDDKGEPTLRFIRWIELVTGQTNQLSREFDSNAVADLYGWPTAKLLEESKSFNYPTIEFESNKIRTVTISGNYTAVPNDFINALNNSEIMFPKYPNVNSFFITRNGDGSTIKLNGNGKKMNGSLTGTITRLETCIEWHYFIDTDEWFAR